MTDLLMKLVLLPSFKAVSLQYEVEHPSLPVQFRGLTGYSYFVPLPRV